MSYEELLEYITSIESDFRFGELFTLVDYFDELNETTGLSDEQTNSLKAALKEKKDLILWCDKGALIDARKEDGVPREKFWWWIDKL